MENKDDYQPYSSPSSGSESDVGDYSPVTKSAEVNQQVSRPVGTAAKSRYQAATQPSSSSEPELSWGETGRQFLNNFGQSAREGLGSYKDAVVNYEDTLGALKQVGKGAMSQLAGAVGVEQDPVKKAENERLIKALEDHWKAYGSVKGIKKALATDPFGTLTDVSSLFGGAGLVGKTAGLSKAAKIASAASAMTDPVQLALKGAGLVSRKAANVPLFAQSVTSGASMGALRDAARAGANPEMSKVFTTHLTDASKHTDVIDAVEQALKKKADERSSAYVASQNEIFGGNPPNLDWSPIDSSLNSSLNSVTNKRTGQVIYNNAAHALSDMKTAINDWKSAGASTIEDFDDLKKKIGDIRSVYARDPQALRVTTDMYNSIIKSITDKHPEYAQMMKRYGEASDELFQIKSTFGIGKKISDESILRKLLSANKSSKKQSLLAELAEVNPEIPYMLAGQELHSWMPGGARQIGHLITAGMYGANPLGLAAQAVSMSPRIAGNVNYKIGQAANLVNKATQPAVTKGAYYAGRANEEQANPDASGLAGGYNVGNIRDEAGGFRSYETPEAAAAAVANNLRSYPDRFNNGKPMTLREIANHWAPSEDNNDPDAWAQNVALTAGVDPDQPIDQNDTSLMQRIIKGVHVAEHGQKKLYPDEVYARAAGPSASASGGRIERASGGKVGNAKHERIVNKLMAMASKAKKATDRTTESLLDEPDESIVKALNVAQQAI